MGRPARSTPGCKRTRGQRRSFSCPRSDANKRAFRCPKCVGPLDMPLLDFYFHSQILVSTIASIGSTDITFPRSYGANLNFHTIASIGFTDIAFRSTRFHFHTPRSQFLFCSVLMFETDRDRVRCCRVHRYFLFCSVQLLENSDLHHKI
jgi:hypothetical protein